MSRVLRLAPGLSLPADVATETFLNVGKRGSGKSTTAARLVEQLHGTRIPFIVLDPVDTWWGLKASRDGGPGLADVYVFGGRKADLPLEPGGGVLLAETVCEHRISAVLSCKHLSGRARSGFMADFARTLFQKWSGGALHVVLEEAHELAPQSPYGGDEEMLGAFKRLWKLGRASGIGGTAITQRPAALHKDITTQAEILIVHRTIGPQDVAAVREWIRYHGEQEKILPELATLKDGEAFVWAPDFPKGDPVGLKRVRILPRETFDSASTPKVGERREEPKRLAQADLAKLRQRMASTIQRAKAEDPRELRKRVAELEAQLVTSEKRVPAAAPPKRVEVSVVSPAEARRLALAVHRMEKVADKLREAVAVMHGVAADLSPALKAAGTLRGLARGLEEGLKADLPKLPPDVRQRATAPPPGATIRLPLAARGVRPHPAHRHVDPGDIGGPEQRILDSLAELEVLGVTEAERVQVALLAGYAHPNSKGFANGLGTLRSRGFVDYPAPGKLSLLQPGREAAQYPESPRSTAELQQRVIGLVGGAAGRVLGPLIQAYPDPLSREDLTTPRPRCSSYRRFEDDDCRSHPGVRRERPAYGHPPRRDLAIKDQPSEAIRRGRPR